MPIDPEEARRYQEGRKQQKEQAQEGRASFISLPREGHAKIRHLPHWEDPNQVPGRIVWQHWNIPEMTKCMCFKTWKMDCRGCLAIAKFTGLIKTEDWEAKGRSYTNALILENTENPSSVSISTPRILGINGYVEFDLDWLVGLALNPDFGDVTDPFVGRDLIYRRKKRDGAWEKQVIPRIRPIADSPEHIREILAKMANLDLIFPKEPRDEDFQNIVKASNLLNQALEAKLNLLMKKGPTYPPAQPITPPAQPATASTTGTSVVSGVAPTPPPAQPVAAPSTPPSAVLVQKKGYPVCFGVVTEFSEANKKCIVCSKSFECEEAVKK